LARVPRNERRLLTRSEEKTQNGTLISTHIRAIATSMFTTPDVSGPSRVNPGARKTRSAVTRTKDWMSWTARHPPNAFHHQRAIPSVCGTA